MLVRSSFEEILSLTSVVDDEKYAYICDAKAWLEAVEKYITIIDTPITPGKCGEVMRMWNEKFGKFIPMCNEQENYVPFRKDAFKIIVVDHVKLTKDNGKGAKNTIDELCAECIYYRNKCNCSFYLVQQANRQSKSMDRRLNGWNSPPYTVTYIENFFNFGELSCRKSAAKICYFDIFFILLIKN